MNGVCPIWGIPAKITSGGGDFTEVDSERTGGRYRVSGSVGKTLPGIAAANKARLTTWIIDQRRAGVAVPVVNFDALKIARDRRPLSLSDRKERFFRAIRSTDPDLDFYFRLTGYLDDEYLKWLRLFASWTESPHPDGDDISSMCQILSEDELIKTVKGHGSLTSKGWSYLEQLTTTGAETTQVFIAMWFSPEMTKVYEEGISLAVRDAGYLPLRIDRKEHNNKIDDEIIAEIKLSKFLVADFTSGQLPPEQGSLHIPRGGVYYEAGFAKGLGMEVISCVRSDQVSSVHFDTRQISHVLWDTPIELRERLYNRIVATVGSAEGAPGRGASS